MNVKTITITLILIVCVVMSFGCTEQESNVDQGQPKEVVAVEEEIAVTELPTARPPQYKKELDIIIFEEEYFIQLEDGQSEKIPMYTFGTIAETFEKTAGITVLNVTCTGLRTETPYVTDRDRNSALYAISGNLEDCVEYGDYVGGYKIDLSGTTVYDHSNIPLDANIYIQNPYKLKNWFISYDVFVEYTVIIEKSELI